MVLPEESLRNIMEEITRAGDEGRPTSEEDLLAMAAGERAGRR